MVACERMIAGAMPCMADLPTIIRTAHDRAVTLSMDMSYRLAPEAPSNSFPI